jgi:hypothetical protein
MPSNRPWQRHGQASGGAAGLFEQGIRHGHDHGWADRELKDANCRGGRGGQFNAMRAAELGSGGEGRHGGKVNGFHGGLPGEWNNVAQQGARLCDKSGRASIANVMQARRPAPAH